MSEYLTCGSCGSNYDDPSCHCLDDGWEEFQDHCVICNKVEWECTCPDTLEISLHYPARGEFPLYGNTVITNGGISHFDGKVWISDVDRSADQIVSNVRWWCNLIFDSEVLT